MVSPNHAQLGRQCRGRDLTSEEQALAAALQAIYGEGIHNFDRVAERLTAAGVVGPVSGVRQWTAAALDSELKGINRSLDDAYAEHGFGA